MVALGSRYAALERKRHAATLEARSATVPLPLSMANLGARRAMTATPRVWRSCTGPICPGKMGCDSRLRGTAAGSRVAPRGVARRAKGGRMRDARGCAGAAGFEKQAQESYRWRVRAAVGDCCRAHLSRVQVCALAALRASGGSRIRALHGCRERALRGRVRALRAKTVDERANAARYGCAHCWRDRLPVSPSSEHPRLGGGRPFRAPPARPGAPVLKGRSGLCR